MNEAFEFADFFMGKLLGFNFSLLNRRNKSLTFLFHKKVKKNNGRMEYFDDMLKKFVVQKLLDICCVLLWNLVAFICIYLHTSVSVNVAVKIISLRNITAVLQTYLNESHPLKTTRKRVGICFKVLN